MAYFQNLTPEDIQNAKNAALLYFKQPNYDDDFSHWVFQFGEARLET